MNYDEAVGRARLRSEDAVALGLIARWLLSTRDGDLTGGDFPGWLVGLFGTALTTELSDQRGECIYSACPHFRRCFIERAVRRARGAEIVVANHALVMVQAARADDATPPVRYVFDEGHHLFQAADSAFSLHLSGHEARELRTWICGGDRVSGSRRRGLRERIGDLLEADSMAITAIDAAVRLAALLPDAGWRRRLVAEAGVGPAESFLALVRAQVLARARDPDPLYSLEVSLTPPIPGLVEAAGVLAQALGALAQPLRATERALGDLLDRRAGELETGQHQRVEGIRRGIRRRALEPLTGWQAMLRAVAQGTPEEFVDWLAVDRRDGREVDVGMHRHAIDPMRAFAATVLAPAHGALITSATLIDDSGEAERDWTDAAMATGVWQAGVTPVREAFASPFDYARQTRVVVVTDVNRNDPRQVAAALRALFVASGGGGLGLFTAIGRLRAVWRLLAEPLEQAGLLLLAQHVDALDTGTLVDIFRAEENSCLLGTDALREGIDVPGRSLRLVVMERVPWPRPTLLHRARRNAFGPRIYDDRVARMRLKQAFGRLVRSPADRGVFVLLDGALPTRLTSAFPPTAPIVRAGLADAVAVVRETLQSAGT